MENKHTPGWGGDKAGLRTQLSSGQTATHRHHCPCPEALCMIPYEDEDPCGEIWKGLEVERWPSLSDIITGLPKREAEASEMASRS